MLAEMAFLRNSREYFCEARHVFVQEFTLTQGMSLEQRRSREAERWDMWPKFTKALDQDYISTGNFDVNPRQAARITLYMIDVNPQVLEHKSALWKAIEENPGSFSI